MIDAVYETSHGDVLDQICHRHYGVIDSAIERVLEANPGLADRGAILPRGVRILLPAVPAENTTSSIQPTVRLWD